MGENAPLLGGDVARDPSAIPGRQCMWLLSWVFIFASIFLTTEFCLLHSTNPPTNELINFFGTLEGILWLQGFILLLYWSFYEVPIDPLGCFGTFLKFMASWFFNVQPASGLIKEDIGVPWTNFAGICLFHSGNMISCVAMHGMLDKKNFWAEGNLPVQGMWVYTLATTLLITADGLDFYEVDSWDEYIKYGQIIGAILLGVGSIIFAYWARPGHYLPQSSSSAYTAIQ
mmetsp:Transcript_32653/g.85502  ORF Transcript_32653/g.85502 Transcript_32653/m.85502 type:complete len:229 (+) Transcript_32653:70-756(+)|eukprot:CAMPEP_0182919752 /NCGR_PEP_ID=MMETSP0105_2-20130417/2955_1 /TAXON_ID=81532 ORGANISM="Acanthoeca-like sp., Strain 10tr" /NCGR_SAMPLE_ID=MMETSP0105_2 /ASSEMBLY_ACC=CAM_ASM_000205 /LENGTH=228 /DNA_ID=CAMNT_0025057007 /DNA_START=53 /DNA_END=739 /DNA_ORIENTATION=-